MEKLLFNFIFANTNVIFPIFHNGEMGWIENLLANSKPFMDSPSLWGMVARISFLSPPMSFVQPYSPNKN
ncbi:MAG: hypothetical protein EBV05_12335 [Cyanobacteria bacterium WB6_1B_304]|nr:hypothetical protein [Cyanobacteria bacterium WB6_1B_304]